MRFTIPLATITVAALVHGAAAEVGYVDVSLEVIPAPGAGAPQIQAKIIDGANVPIDKIRLIDQRGVVVRASSLRAFRDGPDAVAIAFVIDGSEVMMGSDPVDDVGALEAPGYLAGLRQGFAAIDLPRTMPEGSQGMLITYDDVPRLRVPMGPIAKLVPGALGSTNDYHHRLGTNLVQATEMAVDALAHTRTARKFLIVVGDGNDTNNEAALPVFAELKQRAARERIQIFSLIYKSVRSEPNSAITQLVRTSQIAESDGAIAGQLQAIVARISNRYTVTFPGEQLAWNGKPQELTVEISGEPTDAVTLYLGEQPREAGNPLGSWWRQLAIGLGAVGLLALLVRRRAAL